MEQVSGGVVEGQRAKLRMIGQKQMFHYNPGEWRRMMVMKDGVLSLLRTTVLDPNLLKGFDVKNLCLDFENKATRIISLQHVRKGRN